MKPNVGSVDRIVRVVAGLAILGFGLAQRQWWGALGLVPILTASIGWCPAYLPFGISTCARPAPRN